MILTQYFTPRWKKEWKPLATQQLRLRNLIQILAFGIENDNKNTVGSKESNSSVNGYFLNESYYFTLHATIMSAPFYTSEKLKNGSPQWKEFQLSSWEGDVCSSVDAVVVRLWISNAKEDKDKVLAVWGVYFSGLVYLGPNLRTNIPLKPNSIIFLMPGGYFTDPKCIDDNIKLRYSSMIVKKTDVRLSYTVNTLTRVQALQKIIKKEMAEADILKKKISIGDFFRSENRGRTTLRKILSKHKPKTHHTDLIKVKENIEVAKYRVNILKVEKDILVQKVKQLNKQIDFISDSNQLLESKIMENYRILRREVQTLREWKRNYIDKREKYLHSKAMLSFRTKQLISELNLIYPIEEVSPEKFTICGVHLPNSENFTGHDDLPISTALGFVTHVIQMISVFLQIPLRYPVIHFGSRSRIIDQITNKIPDSEREFCLFMKGREKLQFHYAVYLLNKNIAQMRWLCGLPTSDLRNTLENLSSLVKMKFGNSNLERDTRSLSSSTVDICSSTISASSPLGSIMSFQPKKSSRICNMPESKTESSGRSGNSFAYIPKHHVSKSVGCSKDLMINTLSPKNKSLISYKSNINSNLSCSLDKGLNEYGGSSETKDNEQFGSEPFLNSSFKISKILHSDAKNEFLQKWNVESQKAPFSDDDSEFHVVDYCKNQTFFPLISQVSEKINDCSECFKENSINSDVSLKDIQRESKAEPITTESFTADDSKIQNCEALREELFLENKKSNCDTEIDKEDNCDNAICHSKDDRFCSSDGLLENVTSRTEALANQTTCFNRFRTRFKSTLESSN